MDSFELNKFAGALLGSVLLMMVVGLIGESIFHSEKPEQPGYVIEIAEAEETEEAAPEEAVASVLPMLASANIEAGVKVAKKCGSCHDFAEGGKNKIGPALYGVVNRAMGSVADFKYSGGMTELGEAGESWGYEELDGFLTKPKDYLSTTTMGFAGVKKIEDRANLIAYLRSLAATPADLPQPETVEPMPAADETPAADAAPESDTAAPADDQTPAIDPETDQPSETAPAAE